MMSGKSLPTRLIAWCVVAVVAIPNSPLWAQQSNSKTGKEDHTLSSARDSWPIHVTYYPSRLKENAAVVVLLHQKGGSRLVWTRKGGLAEALQGFPPVPSRWIDPAVAPAWPRRFRTRASP